MNEEIETQRMNLTQPELKSRKQSIKQAAQLFKEVMSRVRAAMAKEANTEADGHEDGFGEDEDTQRLWPRRPGLTIDRYGSG